MTAPASPIAASRADVFLSYAREDLSIAGRLAREIEALGHTVAMDTMAIAVGEDWQARLDTILQGAAKVVFVTTPASLASSACKEEIAAAMRQGKPILPVIPGDLPGHHLPSDLRRLNYTRLAGSDDWAAGLAALSQAIGTDLAWERMKAQYLERAISQHPVLTDRAEVLAAQKWAIRRPDMALPVPDAVRQMIDDSTRRLARKDRFLKLGLGLAAVVFAALCSFAFTQWARQVQATGQADVQAALRVAGPVSDLLDQGRQLEALLLLREAAAKLVDTGSVTADMHISLRSALRQVSGQSRYVIPDNLRVHDFGGHILLQDPETGELFKLGAEGLLPTGQRLDGLLVAWDRVPTLGQGILVREVAGTLYFQPFDPVTATSGPNLAMLTLAGQPDGVHQAFIGPDGLVLVKLYQSRQQTFFEGVTYGESLGSWVVDLGTGTVIELASDKHSLWNDRQGASYLMTTETGTYLRFDSTSRAMMTGAQWTWDEHLRNVHYTCFRHELNDPDLELMIARMQETALPDNLGNTAFTLQRPECRFVGGWLATLTGQVSYSGFWRYFGIYDREQLLDRDGSYRYEGFYDPEKGAARLRYAMLRGAALPGLSATDGYDPLFVAFDGRTLIGSFLPGKHRSNYVGHYNVAELQNDAPLEAAVLLGDSLAAWVEAPLPGGQREVIVVDVAAAQDDPFILESDATTSADTPDETLPIRFPDGQAFGPADRTALGLDGWSLSAAGDAAVLVASDWNEGIWRISPDANGEWSRSLMVLADRPASVLEISDDGMLAVVMYGGATLGQTEVYVMSTEDGTIVDKLGSGLRAELKPFGTSGFVEHFVSQAPDDLPIRYDFPGYSGYLDLLNKAIRQLCPGDCPKEAL